MNEDKKLDDLLRSRGLKPAAPDLVARIIACAQGLPQMESLSFWQSLRRVFAEFYLPKPGYVISAALLLGMAAGFAAMPDSRVPEASAISTSFISGDESLL